MRRDAVRALYNCAIRDKKILTTERVKQIQLCLDNKNETFEDSTFKDHIFKLIDLAESLDDFDYKKIFQTYISLLNRESTENIDAILKFLNNQAKDLKRCQELFDENVIEKLIDLLGSRSCFGNKQKEDIAEIINTYLEHEHTLSISEHNLELLMCNTLESNDKGLINAAFTSLLLLSEKAQLLPESILKKLVKYFDIFGSDENYSSYIIFILSRTICAEQGHSSCFLNNAVDLQTISYKLQSDEMVYLTDDDEGDRQRIIIENPAEKNRCNSSNRISLLTANIILKSVENKIEVTSKTIDNLLSSLISSNVDDKQTQIVAAKCLYRLSKYMSLEKSNLNQILDLINSDVYDVGIYIQSTYLNECVKVAFDNDQCLDPVHLENISSLYVSESLKLGQQDYESEINDNFFRTLLYEARKQQFNDKNLFLLLDSIICLNQKYVIQILKVLLVYSRKFFLPETTVRILENILSIPDYFELALSVLQNLIFSGLSSVTSKTLNIFVDNLYTSINSRLRFNSFKLLEKVSRSQDLADDIFLKCELVKAGFALHHHRSKASDSGDKSMIIEFIQRQTDWGMRLPIDTELALMTEIRHQGVLKIFYNASKNGQIIQLNLLNTLIKMFDPEGSDDDNLILIGIFENAAKNNQTLPKPSVT